jgi:hypothetical protein
MISDVVGRYLDSLEEREFDAPFIALLRALGFWDIHFLHGPFEFGKDFIAKAEVEGAATQFAFQTKAGDINLKAWNECRGQIDMLRTDAAAHPSFDATLPRKAVFVTTGRLVGAAAVAAQQYRSYLAARGELDFTSWDKQDLIERITTNTQVLLASDSQGAFLTLIGQIDQGRTVDSDIERYSRRWLSSPKTLCQLTIEAAIIAQRLRRAERLDLSCLAVLALLRAVWMRSHGKTPVDSTALFTADDAAEMFRHYAWQLFDRCGDDMLDPLRFLRSHGSLASQVTYPVFCLRVAEILGLLYLREEPERCSRREELGKFIVAFIRSNPGTAHPISDRWAVSSIPSVLTATQRGEVQTVRDLLLRTTKWLADRYELNSLGLAATDSSPEEEVDRLLGDPFEHVQIDRRAGSYIATVVLDLAAIVGLGDLFNTAINEFLAVELFPTMIECPDTTAQYVLQGGGGLSLTPNVEYAESWQPQDGWKVASHHKRARSDYYLQRIGRYWDHLALSFVLRDRHFLVTCRHFLTA